MAYLVLLVVLAAVVFVVAGPLRRARAGGAASVSANEHARAAELRDLEAAREAKYRELRDAELDHQTGKLSDADFDAVDGALRAEAVAILRRLDATRATIAEDGDRSRDRSGVPGGDGDLPGADALG
jgi:hypothetical protein